MKTSSKTDYALKTILDLAMNRKEGVIRIADIARRQDIPPKFLEQILLLLKGAGIVESRRGAQGGYLLAKNPSKITLASIVRLTENFFTSTPNTENPSPFREVWSDIGEYITNTLERATMQDMCDRASEIQQKKALDYVI